MLPERQEIVIRTEAERRSALRRLDELKRSNRVEDEEELERILAALVKYSTKPKAR